MSLIKRVQPHATRMHLVPYRISGMFHASFFACPIEVLTNNSPVGQMAVFDIRHALPRTRHTWLSHFQACAQY